MEFTKTLAAIIAVIIILLGIAVWYTTQQITPSIPETQKQPVKIQQPIIPQEKIRIKFLGSDMPIDTNKERRATELLTSLAGRHPEQYGLNVGPAARDNVRMALATTGAAMANFSTIDIACRSLVETNTPCQTIDKEYKLSREGIPSHFILYPESDGYTCQAHRDGFALIKTSACQNPSGQRIYLCKAIETNNCVNAYTQMLEDYTYAEMGIGTGESGFCTFVSDPSLSASCQGGDRDAVKNQYIKGYE